MRHTTIVLEQMVNAGSTVKEGSMDEQLAIKYGNGNIFRTKDDRDTRFAAFESPFHVLQRGRVPNHGRHHYDAEF